MGDRILQKRKIKLHHNGPTIGTGSKGEEEGIMPPSNKSRIGG